ncbi:MAG: MaoC family dehydratase [Pseudomonadota bacterium]
MSISDFIREKNEKFQRNHSDIMNKLEPQLRDFSDIVLRKIASTKNNPWFAKLSQAYEGEVRGAVEVYPPVQELYEKLSELIGQEIGVGEWFTLDQNRINEFANVTEDHQWIHTDAERAKKESPYRCTVSHGFLMLSLLPRLTGSVGPINDLHTNSRMVVNCGLNRVRFPYPAKAGVQIRATTTLKEIVCLKKSIELVNEISVEEKNSKRIVCVAETILRIYV